MVELPEPRNPGLTETAAGLVETPTGGAVINADDPGDVLGGLAFHFAHDQDFPVFLGHGRQDFGHLGPEILGLGGLAWIINDPTIQSFRGRLKTPVQAQGIDTEIADNLQEPWLEGAAGMEAFTVTQAAQEGLLDHVMGQIFAPGDPPSDRPRQLLVTAHQAGEGQFIPGGKAGAEDKVLVWDRGQVRHQQVEGKVHIVSTKL